MTFTIMLSIFGGLVVLMALVLIRGSGPSIASVNDLVVASKPTDLEAFLNLVDPDEENFLRLQMGNREFARVKRARLLAAADYIFCILHNSGLLARIGNSSLWAHDAQAQQIAGQIAVAAIRLRVVCFLTLLRLSVSYAFPDSRLSVMTLIEGYRLMAGSLRDLCDVSSPEDASRIWAAL